MAAKKIKDIAVKTGEYQDRNTGDTKGRYQNVGALMKNEDGSVFILLARWFSPAGVNSDRETVLLSCFDLRDKDDAGKPQRSDTQRRDPISSGRQNNMDDDIPF